MTQEQIDRAQIAVLEFSKTTVDFIELPERLKKPGTSDEEIEDYLFEELGYNVEDTYFMCADKMNCRFIPAKEKPENEK